MKGNNSSINSLKGKQLLQEDVDIQDDPRALKAIFTHKLRNKHGIIKQEQRWKSLATVLYGSMVTFVWSTLSVSIGLSANILYIAPFIGVLPILVIMEEDRLIKGREMLEISKISDQELKYQRKVLLDEKSK